MDPLQPARYMRHRICGRPIFEELVSAQIDALIEAKEWTLRLRRLDPWVRLISLQKMSSHLPLGRLGHWSFKSIRPGVPTDRRTRRDHIAW